MVYLNRIYTKGGDGGDTTLGDLSRPQDAPADHRLWDGR